MRWKIKASEIRKSKKYKKKYEKKIKQYSTYMASEEWKRRRRQYLQGREKYCDACESKKRITVHHKTYSNLGHEKDNDLCLLCRPCHNEYHRGVTNTSRKSTDEFIVNKKHTVHE